MIINHNIAALNTYRQLSTNNVGTQKSLEKLSSGLRINRAGDDAAGLAISEKMRAQVRGLDQASRNSQDAISLIQTAEGALNETHSILQRMRELATQAANDTNVEIDRNEIQKEINQLTSEINRIGNTTEFNTMNLVNGDRAIKTTSTPTEAITKDVTSIKDGLGGSVSVNKSIGVTISATEDAWKSSIAEGISIGKDPAADDAIQWDSIDLTASAKVTLGKDADGNLTVKLEATGNGQADVFVHEATFNADTMKTAATNGIYKVEFHGVSFDLNINEFKDVGANSTVTLDLTTAHPAAATDVTGNYGLKHDFTDPAQAADFTSFTIDGSNATLVGIASLEISVADADTIVVKGYDADDNVILNDSTKLATALIADGTFEYSENGISFTFAMIKDAGGNLIDGFTTNKLDVADLVAQKVTETVIDKPAGEKITVVSDKSLFFQVGANENQAMALDINDMRALALGISSTSGGAGFAAGQSVTDGTNNTTVEYALDVSNHKAAAASITTINNAIETVSAERSKLGAVQNRLEHTINNLGTSSENLTAAESRIRDVDMAKEMMEFTKQNILSQAAQAMLNVLAA